MVWAAFRKNGYSEIPFLTGRQNSARYCETLERYFLPFAQNNHSLYWTFQQYNASIHTNEFTRQWLTS